MAMLRLHNVSKQFDDKPALRSLSLEIADGEFLVLVGPSGCGKSTLLRLLAGLETVSDGEIWLDGDNITAQSPRERNFAMIFQNYALFPHLTVKENITFGMQIRHEPKASWQPRLEKVAHLLQLDTLLDRKPGKLSGGQRQRVAMARAIVRDPKLFLMDEPLSNLDARLRTEVRDGIMTLHQQLKTSTVYVTHDQIEAMSMADRIVVMNNGEVQQVGTPEQLYAFPTNLFVASFIGSPAMNIITLPCSGGVVQIGEKNTSSAPPRGTSSGGVLRHPPGTPHRYARSRTAYASRVRHCDATRIDGRRLSAAHQHANRRTTLQPQKSRRYPDGRRHRQPRLFTF
ncbi:hypothetical protein OS11_05690 [Dickeya oryzae]